MNSCFRSAETGEFTGSDVTALLALYPRAAGSRLSFRTATGNFLVAENGGGTFVGADRTAIRDWERFGYVDLNGDELLNNDLINLRAANGQFVVAENGGGGNASGAVNANRSAIGAWETFVLFIQ